MNHVRRVCLALLGVTLSVLFGSCQTPGTSAPTFHNPLNALDGADPWLQFYDGNYYLTSTQVNAIRMWKSPTLAGLADVKPTTIWSDATPARCCNMWAPEFHLLDGPGGKRWYVYYTAGTDRTLDNQRMHVLESAGSDPLGPYTYKAQLVDPSNNGWAIDASVLTMPDNKLYLLFSSWVDDDQTMFIAPMSDPWTVSGTRVLLSKPTFDWERSVGNVNEGPVALQHDGKTFIVYSASACWGDDYKLGMLTYNGGAVLDTNSWVKSPEPVFERSDANSVYAPGHNGFFASPDGKENWIVYHANSKAGEGCVGKRTTRVQKFTWNDDGTPNFSTPASLDTPIAAPSGERAATIEPAAAVFYNLVSKSDQQCLGADQALARQACGDAASQQWRLDYLANGHYRLLNRGSGKALTASASTTSDAAPIEQAAWARSANQQWRITQAKDGWVRIEARENAMVLEVGGCGASGANVQQGTAQDDNACQQFRLQPTGSIRIINANSSKPIVVGQNLTEVVQWHDTDMPDQPWRFMHRENGYYQIIADQNGTCLSTGGGTNGSSAALGLQACGDAPEQQWRFDQLNDGMIRLIARPSGKVAEIGDCQMADGVALRESVWMDTFCQRFRLVAP